MKQGIVKNNIPSKAITGTKRFCSRCNKLTKWDYNPIARGVGHSYCCLCGFIGNTSIQLQEQTNEQKMESMRIKIKNQAEHITNLEKKVMQLNAEIVVLTLKLNKELS